MQRHGLNLLATTSKRASRSALLWSRRMVHARRELAYPVENGFGEFLPPAALKTVAVDYQQGLLDRLNDQIKDNAQLSRQSVAQTVIDTASDRSRSQAFNYASLALNNSFFLDSLKPPSETAPTHEAEISPFFRHYIQTQFGSLEQLKATVGATATGMAGSGYVWLVTDNSGQLAVLPTFAAGTLLVRARQQTTPNSGPILGEIFGHQAASGSITSPTSPASGVVPPSTLPTTPPHARAFSTTSTTRAESLLSSYDPSDPTALADTPLTPVPKSRNLRNMGDIIWPLFAVPVQEHCWMSAGFGVWGQEEWIRKFWTVLDWKKVSDAFAAHAVDRKGPIA